MYRAFLIVLSLFSTACTSLGTQEPTSAAPAAVRSAADAAAPRDADGTLRVVEVDVVDEAAADVVCRKEYRRGTRIVIGETCRPRGQLGVSVQTRDDLQRELSGHGWQAGWKSQQQIDAERSLGARMPRR